MDLLRKTGFLSILFLLHTGQGMVAQDHEHSLHDHEHHNHSKNEVGVANNLVFLGEEGAFAFGLHLHYVRNIGASRFGYGLGYEHIFDDHLHRNLGIIGSFIPIQHLILNVSPGITFIGRDKPEKSFALHLEANYEFEIGDFHMGPAVEYAYSGHGYHLSLGLHFAYAF
ncbi:MAG: hypothetical protein ABFS10_09290 [Bacteroidota bacterium]